MSQHDRPFSTLEMDIWRMHESILQKLYIEENKTLKEVKDIMELHHGFPSFSIATYGTKLRHHLNLQKKLKKDDWLAVYQHYERRRAEGKQSRMYLNDTLIPWRKAWKEIRRNRVQLGSGVMPLPRGVMLKTPPPRAPISVCNSSQLIQLSPPIQSLQIVPRNAHEPAPMALEPRQPFSLNVPFPESLEGNVLSRSSQFYRQLSLICLENTPWVALKATLLSGSILTPTTTLHRSLIHGVEHAWPRSYALPGPNSNELSTQFDPIFTLARVFYLISNNLFSNDRSFHGGFVEQFNLLCSRMPQRLVLDLLDSNLPSTNAALEAIARLIYYVERKDFIDFMSLAFNRPTRILPHTYAYLSVAVSKNCNHIVRHLLQLGARADEKIPEWKFKEFFYIRPAIFEAIASQDVECLQLLLEHCDVNVPVFNIEDQELSISSIVLTSMGHHRQGFDFNRQQLKPHPASLAILLEHGANVDIPCPKHLCRKLGHRRETTKALPNMEPSLLEHCYFYNKAVYDQLLPFSSRTSHGVYRDEICFAAAQGPSALLAYFNSKPSVDATSLEYVLEEQFFLDTSFFNSAVVRALLELGVTISTLSPSELFTKLLCRVIQHIRLFGYEENHTFILDSLLRKGALLNSEVLALAVEDEGTRILELLLTLGGDFRREGAKALGTAARLNNFCAVSWLLRNDVDINAEINSINGFSIGSMSIAMAIQKELWDPKVASRRFPNVRMVINLIHHGAKIWYGSRDSCPFTALRVILQQHSSNPYLFDTVSLILDHYQMLKDLPHSGSFLLEDSLVRLVEWSATHSRSKVFELLLRHGAPIYPGAVLSRLIDLAAPRELVLDLMNRGADISAYTTSRDDKYNAIQAASKWWDQSLISTLMERGGDINSPALGPQGRTALQVACSVTGTSEANRRAQLTFVEFLLRNNADVNAPPCTRDPNYSSTVGGYTALQLAAAAGNLELLSLLLSHKAHVNLPSHLRRRCALDVAAEEGRLDALHFLLKAGALSYCHGQSGYEGAIQLAERKGFSVVAESLRSHIRHNERLFYEQPALAEAHSAAMAERSWTDECFSVRK
ncbi:hypothetical protein F5B22DRAFT_643850 [Xylaria bambusicola]|uniref:uncharacterized protein n=1 Tax=Xylaria bambusicola TaxID=326684 RepID=UPI002008AB6A|nr:uncharacterized protein F5B22DRAFT_643850 [Xylaria bambusicola]KAI0521678.1 hypothetical protein F5B22DRAFT_643850 [Xylaria bambusicola]